ncbi:MAG: RNA-binding protein [Roseomonas sp.]|nr:RNA-binding protein [Roseomonas sp.]MCA3276125.1 RNA-binding protein [Roseomonas sp.]MCA3281558.1 RNA-binding protein [Roseomonas sp.]MCA3287023.1 RNA-binding protein [Roseomonas sp.]MCA3289026.1 RNA-binding protein [Roseomonas sp.]
MSEATALPEEDEPEKGPLRRCIVTRESLPKAEMIRFVLGPGREILPDLAEKLPGRGMWLSARGDVLEGAISRGAFTRAARGPVVVPPGLPALLQQGLRTRIADLLGLARRAGQAVAGWQAVREWRAADRIALLVQAKDGSPAERERLSGGGMAAIAPLSAAELGRVFGRDHIVHVAVAPGRLAEAIRSEAGRLSGLSPSEVSKS